MNTLHPHWQSTDDGDEVPITIHTRNAERPKNDAVTSAVRKPKMASRRPAAFVGIMLFVILGAASMNGYLSLRHIAADVTSTQAIHIGATGVSPNDITVQPGGTITWVNDDTIPHVIGFDALYDSTNALLLTTPIFPGGSYDMTVPSSAAAGSKPSARVRA